MVYVMNVPTIAQANLTSSYVVAIDQPTSTSTALTSPMVNGQWSMVNGQADIYDLHGRKVSELKKGVYIKNGRKIIVK